jgi:glycerol kinase
MGLKVDAGMVGNERLMPFQADTLASRNPPEGRRDDRPGRRRRRGHRGRLQIRRAGRPRHWAEGKRWEPSMDDAERPPVPVLDEGRHQSLDWVDDVR